MAASGAEEKVLASSEIAEKRERERPRPNIINIAQVTAMRYLDALLAPPGLDIDGLRSANGVAPSVPLVKALLQGGGGLRLYKVTATTASKAKPNESEIKNTVKLPCE